MHIWKPGVGWGPHQEVGHDGLRVGVALHVEDDHRLANACSSAYDTRQMICRCGSPACKRSRQGKKIWLALAVRHLAGALQRVHPELQVLLRSRALLGGAPACTELPLLSETRPLIVLVT